jgi:hypothetical protein
MLVLRSNVCGNNELFRNVIIDWKKVVDEVGSISSFAFAQEVQCWFFQDSVWLGRRRFSGLCKETIRMG